MGRPPYIAHPSMIIQAGKEIAKRAPFAFSEETKSLYKQSKYGNCFCQTRSFLHNFRRQHPNIYFNLNTNFFEYMIHIPINPFWKGPTFPLCKGRRKESSCH